MSDDNFNHINDTAPEKICWTPQLVEQFWNGVARTRLKEHSFSKTGGRSLIITIEHMLSKKAKILDFGAGDGDLIKFLCERGCNAAAYEPAKKRAEILKENLQNFPGFLGVINQDTTHTFDLIIMAEVIEHVLDEQLDSCLKNVQRLTKLGGHIVITTPNNEDLELGMTYCPANNMLFHRWQHVRSFTKQRLVNLLSNYGFAEVVTHQLEFNDAIYLKYDEVWGEKDIALEVPDYIQDLRNNRPAHIGSESNLLYIGQRVE